MDDDNFSEATPRPWSIAPYYEEGSYKIVAKQGPVAVCRALANSRADAELIVTAVNNYDWLKSENERLEGIIDAMQQDRTAEILALSYDKVIAAHVAAYRSAEKAVEATWQMKLSVEKSMTRFWEKMADRRLKVAEELIREMQDFIDKYKDR